MSEQEWSVDISATGTGPFGHDFADDVIEALTGHGPALSVANDEVSVRFSIDAPSVEDACQDALALFRNILPDLRVFRIEVETADELDMRLAADDVPELLGVAELAQALGVSKQRISELTELGRFPAPVARLKAGPVWQRSAIARFVRRWPRRAGRPRARPDAS
jgi:hypothetical protein